MAKNPEGTNQAGVVLEIAPEDPRIVVEKTDETSPYYDPRVDIEIDEDFLMSLALNGQLEPGICRKDGETLRVVDGRTRHSHELELNRRIAAGDERYAFREGHPVKFKFTVRQVANDKELARISLHANARPDEPPVITARRIHHFVNVLNFDKAEVMTAYKWKSPASVDNKLLLLDCSPAVQESVNTGEITEELARALAKEDMKTQDVRLEELRATGRTRGSAAMATVTSDRSTGAAPSSAGKKQLGRRFCLAYLSELEKIETPTGAVVRAIVRHLMGDKKAWDAEDEKTTEKLAPFKEAAKRAKKK